MSIGYGSVGEFAIGEFGSTPVVVDMSSVVGTIGVQILSPVVTTGVLVDAPAATIQFTAVAPVVLTDVLFNIPQFPACSITLLEPQILHSVNLVVPNASIGVAIAAPKISGGAIVQGLPAPAHITFKSGGEPTLFAGKLVDVPSMSIHVGLPVPIDITHSVNLAMPSMTMSFTFPKPDFGGGALIVVGNTHTTVSYGGGIGDSAIGEFGIGEGPPLFLTTHLPMRMFMHMPPLTVQAGKIIDWPSMNIGITAPVPEVDSRRRKLKMSAIAS